MGVGVVKPILLIDSRMEAGRPSVSNVVMVLYLSISKCQQTRDHHDRGFKSPNSLTNAKERRANQAAFTIPIKGITDRVCYTLTGGQNCVRQELSNSRL